MKILCVCYGNTCRIPMLSALLKRELESRGILAEVESAGVEPLDTFEVSPASSYAIEVMAEMGLDISAHVNQQVSRLNLSTYDIIYSVDKKYVPYLNSLGAENVRVLEGIPNPYKKGKVAYRKCAEVLAQLVKQKVL